MHTKRTGHLLGGVLFAAALTFVGAGAAGATPANDNHPAPCDACHGDEPGEPGYQPPFEEECDEDGNCVCLQPPGFMDPGPGAPRGPFGSGPRW